MSREQGIILANKYDSACGKKYIEGMAGLWSTSLGFQHKRLVAAATKQQPIHNHPNPYHVKLLLQADLDDGPASIAKRFAQIVTSADTVNTACCGLKGFDPCS